MNLTAENTARRPVVVPRSTGRVRLLVTVDEIQPGDWVERFPAGTLFHATDASAFPGGWLSVPAGGLVEVERRVPWVSRPRGAA